MVEHNRAPRSVELLKEQLKSNDQNTRLASVEELSSEGSPSAIKILIMVANGKIRRDEIEIRHYGQDYKTHWYSLKKSTRLVPYEVQVGPRFDLIDQLAAITALSEIEKPEAESYVLRLGEIVSSTELGSFAGTARDFGAIRDDSPVYNLTTTTYYGNIFGELSNHLPRETRYDAGDGSDAYDRPGNFKDESSFPINEHHRILLEAINKVKNRQS